MNENWKGKLQRSLLDFCIEEGMEESTLRKWCDNNERTVDSAKTQLWKMASKHRGSEYKGGTVVGQPSYVNEFDKYIIKTHLEHFPEKPDYEYLSNMLRLKEEMVRKLILDHNKGRVGFGLG